jgi:hypothetical protein
MSLFFKHLAADAEPDEILRQPIQPSHDGLHYADMQKAMDVLCDEEAIHN